MAGTRYIFVAILSSVLIGPRAFAALDGEYIEDADRFPGWRGELPVSVVEAHDSVGFGELGKVRRRRRPRRAASCRRQAPPRPRRRLTRPPPRRALPQELWRGRVEQISWRPRAFLYHNFLSDEECDHLMALGEGHMRKSTVVDSTTGGSVDSQVRTSSGTFLASHQDEVVERIEKRLAHVSMIPEENGESIQLLKYVNGQKYEPHTDYFHDKVNADPAHGGQRVATVLMYLSTPDEGGETVSAARGGGGGGGGAVGSGAGAAAAAAARGRWR
jgi:prolyl 4-hydroxylase